MRAYCTVLTGRGNPPLLHHYLLRARIFPEKPPSLPCPTSSPLKGKSQLLSGVSGQLEGRPHPAASPWGASISPVFFRFL